MVSAAFNRDKKTSYAELIGGKYFNVQLDWNKQIGNALYAPGKAQPKKHTEHKIVGKPIKREDVAPKVFAPGGLRHRHQGAGHGARPHDPAGGRGRGAGQGRRKLDQGHSRAPRWSGENGFLGVVADKEWDAIQAAEKLKVEWSKVEPPFPDQNALYDHIRKAPVRKRAGREAERQRRRGVQDRGARDRGRVRMAVPVARRDGTGLRAGRDQGRQGHLLERLAEVALRAERRLPRTLGVPLDNVHVQLDDRARAPTAATTPTTARWTARVLAKAVGKPVRVQYMRDEGTGWDPKGPASIHRARAAIDAQGNVIAYEFISKGFSRVDVNTNGSKPIDTLAGHTLGVALKSGDSFGVPAESYEFANKQTRLGDHPAAARPLLAAAHVASARSGRAADPLRQRIVHGRGGGGDQPGPDRVPAASTSRTPRDSAVIKAAAQKFGWDTRPSPRKDQTGDKVSGRGIAYSPAQRHQRRGDRAGRGRPLDRQDLGARSSRSRTTAARSSTRMAWRSASRATSCRAFSRTLWEEVKFDNKSVTSVDWQTYPILDITETPEKIDFVLINHPELPPTGAGEPSIRPVAAAIANAIFDATGVRIRRVPFSPDRVKQALS